MPPDNGRYDDDRALVISVDTPTPPCCNVVAFNVFVTVTLFPEFIIIAPPPEPEPCCAP